ncbi:MAG TPA: hypothetical protein VFI35_09515 [Actinomycetota bacterium]|nr:hypothetical protein [Actinomycetota bacterium]
MLRITTTSETAEREHTVPVLATPIAWRKTMSAPYQIRTCVRCGLYTTFIMDDPAGGWYRCTGCGCYA